MTSASAPSSLVSHDDNSPADAVRHRLKKRRRTSASKASSRRYQRSGPASRQNARIAAGVTEASTIDESAPYALYAAAFFSSRSSRRRILPTLVLGRSVLNSICLGTL